MIDSSNRKLFFLFMIALVTAGTLNTVSNKLILLEYSLGKPFSHVIFSAFLIVLAESTIMLLYLLQIFFNCSAEAHSSNQNTQNQTKPISLFYLAIPGICDALASCFCAFGLRFLNGSVYRMFGISKLLLTSLFSVIFLKNKFYRHHFLGMIFIFLGLACVGTATLSVQKNKHSIIETITGFFLVLLGMIFVAVQFITEELFSKKYMCNPMRMIAFEGVWATLFCFVLMVIFYFIPCNPGGQLITSYFCSQDDEGNWKVDDPFFAMKQIWYNPMIGIYALLNSGSYVAMQMSGISFAKYSSCANRSAMDIIRTVLVWLFFLMPVVREKHRETFLLLQFLGFILLVIGNLIFNEIIEIDMWGLSDDLRRKILAKAKKDKELEGEIPKSKLN